MFRLPPVVPVLLALLCAASRPAAADRADDVIHDALRAQGIPGIALVVLKEGRVVKSRGYGLADLEHGARATPDTVFQVASLTKQFTAAAVLLLAADGKMALDAPVGLYLPELPERWQAATVRSLLTHTSGVKNHNDLPGFDRLYATDATRDEILKLVTAYPPASAPGEQFAYNNTGCNLPGWAVEAVSRQTLGAFLRARVFGPLGMDRTRLNAPAEVVPGRARGYVRRGGALANAPYGSPSWSFAAGALLSTANDPGKWDAALREGKLLPRSEWAKAVTPHRLNSGEEVPYGFGWALAEEGGRRVAAHGGGRPGFSCFFARCLDGGLSVALLCGLGGADVEDLTRRVARLYLPPDPKPAPANKSAPPR